MDTLSRSQGPATAANANSTRRRRGATWDLDNVSIVDELFEHPSQALLGDPQDFEKFRHGQAGQPVDKVQNPMVRSSETILVKDGVRIGREIPVGEEQMLDDCEVNAIIQCQRGFDRVGVCHACWLLPVVSVE